MESLFQLAASIGGIGGLLAVLIFFIYRQDRKATEERLNKLIDRDQITREQNTKVLSELVTLLQRINGRMK